MSDLVRVLYIDDSAADRDLVCDALERDAGGFVVVQAADREQFEARLADDDYDLILSDFNILGFEGLDVIDLVNQKCPLVPVVIVTGTGSEMIAVEAMKRGAADYVIKTPDHIRRLPVTIRAVLERARLEADRRRAEAALVESEARFRSIVESATVGMIVVADEAGVITDWNPGAERAFGYSVGEAVGQPLTMLMPSRHRTAHGRAFAEAVKTGGSLSLGGVTSLMSGLRKNGKEFPVELTLDSWRRDGALFFRAVMLDITGRKEAEEVLRRAERMDAVRRLTGSIAHDFNNILGIILGNVSLLQSQVAGQDELLKRVDTIQKSAQRAAELTRQLDGFSSRQAAKVAPTSINRVIRGMAALLDRSVTRDVAVYPRLAESLWLTEIDSSDFEDALLHLAINARDAMPDGGRLTVETCNATLDAAFCAQNPGAIPGDYVRLAVSDNGAGIPVERREHIFEPFFTTKGPSKGTGLGLALVFGFVNRSGGYLKVHSEIDIGSIFWIYLPRSAAEHEVVDAAIAPGDVLPRGTETILVVDDENELLELARSFLEPLGYRVLTAGSGPEALDQLAEGPAIALLFSDVVMPDGMSGYELTKEARATHPDLKVLFTSGSTESVARNEQAELAGNVLTKPYSQAGLALRVREILGEPPEAPVQPIFTPIEWSEALSLGIEALDDDHRVLLGLVNRSRQAAADGDATMSVTILGQLRDYAESHFRREEAVMNACDYPGLQRHREVHRLLLVSVEKMRRQLSQGALSAEQLATFLCSWLEDHTRGMDRAFAAHCRGHHGLSAEALAQASRPPREDDPS